MASKLFEKMTMLVEASEGLLTRVYHMRQTFVENRPKFFFDKSYDKVAKEMMKFFPKHPTNEIERVPGAELIRDNSRKICLELEQHYVTMLDVLEFKEEALDCIRATSQHINRLNMTTCPDLMCAFFNLMVGYIQVNILLSQVADRRMCSTFYAYSYQYATGNSEANFGSLATFLYEFEDPLRKIREEFSNLTKIIGEGLLTLSMSYLKNTTMIILKEGLLNLSTKPETIQYPIQDQMYWELTHLGEMTLWIQYGALCCPSTFSITGMSDLLKHSLTQGFLLPVCRDEFLLVHAEFQNLMREYKDTVGNKANKTMIKESTTLAVERSGQMHKDRRVYLRMELTNLLHFLTDCPGLLGPKIQLVWAIMSLARDEVVWFFRHTDRKPENKDGTYKKASFQPDDFKDKDISEFVYLLFKLSKLIRTHRSVLEEYHVEFLSGPDVEAIAPLVDEVKKTVGEMPGVAAILDDIVNTIRNIKAPQNLGVMRLNYGRALTALNCTNWASANIKKAEPLITKLNLVMAHSRNIDSIDAQINEHASLKELYHFPDTFNGVFQASLAAGPHHCMAMVNLLNEFLQCAHPFLPEERIQIGESSVKRAEKFLQVVVRWAQDLIEAMHFGKGDISCQSLFMQITPEHALRVAAEQPQNKSARHTQANPLTALTSEPGKESDPGNRVAIDGLRRRRQMLTQVCFAIEETPVLVIYDQQFQPIEYLREGLRQQLSKFYDNALKTESGDLQRPTKILANLTSFLSTLRVVEECVNINLTPLVQSVLSGQVWDQCAGYPGLELHEQLAGGSHDPSAGRSKRADSTVKPVTVGAFEPVNGEDRSLLVHQLSAWYYNFLGQRMLYPCSQIFFAPARKGFISSRANPFKAEHYADYSELRALCALIGPAGVRVFDRDLMQMIVPKVRQIKEILAANRVTLQELAQNYTVDSTSANLIKKLSGLDQMMVCSITIGLVLSFRTSLHEALGDVMRSRMPFVFDTLQGAFDESPYHDFRSLDFSGLDTLSYDVGVSVGLVDQPLKNALAMGGLDLEDHTLWNLLPIFYAAGYHSKIWQDAEYNVNFMGHQNNAHTIVSTFLCLMTASENVSRGLQGPADKDKHIADALKTFVQASSVMLMRLKPHRAKAEFYAMCVFLDKVIEASETTSDVLRESCFPYALFRSMYVELYSGAARYQAETNAAQEQEGDGGNQ